MGYTGVCWDCDGRVVLRHLEDRVLLPTSVADEEARSLEVGKWIEDRYNRRRRHASIGQVSPVAFEMHYFVNTAALKIAA